MKSCAFYLLYMEDIHIRAVSRGGKKNKKIINGGHVPP